MNFGYLFILFIIILIIYYYYKSLVFPIVLEKSSLDNNQYWVRNEIDKKEAANLISLLVNKTMLLIKQLKNDYPNNIITKRLENKFNPKNIMESYHKGDNNTYTVNKGEMIYICLRNKDTNKLIDINILFYVLIHEITHLTTTNLKHDEYFWNNYKFLLKHAIKYKLYKYENYNKYPVKYCDIIINSSPN